MGLGSKILSGAFEEGPKMIENAFTGVQLSSKGRLGLDAAFGASLGATLVANKAGLNTQEPREVPGVQAPPQLNYEGKANTPMGADGDLALALSKLK